MTSPDILSEMNRLNAYLKDRKDNLPAIVFELDAGVKACNERIKELELLLDEATKQAEKETAQRVKRREEANKRLHVYMDKLFFIREELEALTDLETRAKAAEMSNMIAQMLLKYTPQTKDK